MKRYFIALTAIWIVAAASIYLYSRTAALANQDFKKSEDMFTLDTGIRGTFDKPLPTSIDKISTYGRLHNPLVDYEYHVTGKNTYQMCTSFARDTSGAPTRDSGGTLSDFEKHKAGHQCFDLQKTD